MFVYIWRIGCVFVFHEKTFQLQFWEQGFILKQQLSNIIDFLNSFEPPFFIPKKGF